MNNKEHSQIELDLREALAERNLLFAELQHRTRNTIQMISAFLVLEENRAKGVETKTALRDVLRRIDSLNAAERALAGSEAQGRVDLGRFLPTVLQELMELEGRPNISLQTVIENEVETSVDQGRVLGLLVGELATNALKHAFPGARGKLSLRLQTLREGLAQIELADDGVGWQSAARPSRSGGLGLGLIDALTRQAEAKLTLDGSRGVRATLNFTPTSGKALPNSR